MSASDQTAPAFARTGWKRRASSCAFLMLVAIAMLGWLVGLAWLAMSIAGWLFA